jgi:hypothetical protein
VLEEWEISTTPLLHHSTTPSTKEVTIMPQLNKGFVISLDTTRKIVKVQAWGFWDADLVKKYRRAFAEKIKELRANGNEWYALMDFREFLPRSEEIQQMMNEHIASVQKEGMKKIGYLGERLMVQLRLNRVFREEDQHMSAFFDSEREAIRWLLKDHPTKSRSP